MPSRPPAINTTAGLRSRKKTAAKAAAAMRNSAEGRNTSLPSLKAAARIDAEGPAAARVDISVIKFYVAGVLQRVIDRAIQVHGGLGVTDDTLLSFWYRHERGARIYDGADEVHKDVVARHILKQYGIDTRAVG